MLGALTTQLMIEIQYGERSRFSTLWSIQPNFHEVVTSGPSAA